jgi:ribosomal protein S18 acetylase RimI-like enzyme
MRIVKFDRLNNIDKLSKIIYLNFIELQNVEGIVFNIDDIFNTLNSNNLLGWFIIYNERIIGYIIGELKDLVDGRFVYYISYIYIIKRHRSQGLGFKLMLNCINYINNANIKFIMLTCNKNGKAFQLYKKLGFIYDPIIKINNPDYNVLTFYCNTN